jgi:acyl phosphate:glycerol-3-phosphate acyltransferase
MLSALAAVLLAYLLGSLSSAIIVCRLMRLPDPRTVGSGNPGATNVLRVAGKGTAAVVLAGDMLKGFVPVMLASAFGLSAKVLALTGLGAFLGHLYPVFFGFRGGKGVATYLGVIIGLSWMVGLATGATWVAMALVFRYSSLAAVTAAILSPVYMAFITGVPAWTLGTVIMSILLTWRHGSNLRRLLAGTEERIGTKR